LVHFHIIEPGKNTILIFETRIFADYVFFLCGLISILQLKRCFFNRWISCSKHE